MQLGALMVLVARRMEGRLGLQHRVENASAVIMLGQLSRVRLHTSLPQVPRILAALEEA
jgi:hypothetical protein